MDRDDGKRECDVEGCHGSLAPVWSASDYLMDERWCEQVGPEQTAVLAVAFEWAIGEIRPPPGMMYPKTEREAKAVWEHLLDKASVTL